MILERNLLPFIATTFPDGHRLWRDNDPKHTSNSTKQWMKDNGVNHWATPPESPVSIYNIYIYIYIYTYFFWLLPMIYLFNYICTVNITTG